MSLSLENVSVDLGARRVIDAVSLRVQAGEVVALLGRNGAGKTSLMRAGLGLAPVTEGRVELGGADPRRLSSRERALRAAYLPQRPQAIWPISVERLVALGRYAHGAAPERLGPRDQEAVDQALDVCALIAMRARRMDELSGGKQARAHLARALAQTAPLMALDEPTAGLDPAQALGVSEVLADQARAGRAVLICTHDLGLAARVADRVDLLCAGRVLSDGAPDALPAQALAAASGRNARMHEIEGVRLALFD